MSRVKVTGYMDSDDMGRFYDPKHKMGVTDAGYEQAQALVQFQDGEVVTVHLDEIDFQAVND